MFPHGFFFGVVIPLDLGEPRSLVACDPILLVENPDEMCLVCQIRFEWDDVFDNNSQRLHTSFELGDMKTL
jgi:hypothetical protein